MIQTNSLSPVSQMMGQDVVQSVVHDLRSPMAVIKGNLKLLLSGMMGQMTDEQMMLIQRSVDPLEELILLTENLLQSASLEQTDLTLHVEETDLDKLLSEAIGLYAEAFKQRDMRLFRDGNTVGMKLSVDTHWIKRVLNNLIWNAYKFTPDHGQVMIQVSHDRDGIEIAVEDTGRGIPAAKLDTLFQKFCQVSSGDFKVGTGLGLWICKKVLELHQGSIRAESTEGKGSRFILRFPSSCIL